MTRQGASKTLKILQNTDHSEEESISESYSNVHAVKNLILSDSAQELGAVLATVTSKGCGRHAATRESFLGSTSSVGLTRAHTHWSIDFLSH